VDTAVHFSSASDDWETPQKFFDALNAEFGFTLDVCATAKNAKCQHFISSESLSRPWAAWSRGSLWMNPPYGRTIGKWVAKARETADQLGGRAVVCLLPARTDTAWWHDHVIGGGAEIRFVRGRLKFGNSKNSAPFPSAVVIFRSRGGREP
jgi:phage N-6-adenine-methyltransferase